MDPSFLSTLAPLVLVFAIFYFLIIRPQQQRTKQHRLMVQNVRRGDTVVTAGGHIAVVSKAVKPDDEHVTVEIADGVHTKVLKSTLAEVRTKGQDADKS
jgi:preprotein translocase subunit YajC